MNRLKELTKLPVYSVHIGQYEGEGAFIYLGKESYSKGVFNVDIDILSIDKSERVNISQLIIGDLNNRGNCKLIGSYHNGNRNILMYEIW